MNNYMLSQLGHRPSYKKQGIDDVGPKDTYHNYILFVTLSMHLFVNL